MTSSPIGLHRVITPAGVLPQAAFRLDSAAEIAADEVRIAVQRLNLDAASFRQLHEAHGGDGAAMRDAVGGIVEERGKMHNPVTGSGGMLIGTVDEVGSQSPLGLRVGEPVATLVSLTLTPLAIGDALAGWDGQSEQIPCQGHAILFAHSIAAVLPDDMPAEEALAIYDVCGAPALTTRLAQQHRALTGKNPTVAVLGAAGKSGSLCLAAARTAGAEEIAGVVRDREEATRLRNTGLAGYVTIADCTDAVEVSTAVHEVLGAPADITVVCVDVPGCEHGAILSTAAGGTVIFFSMATSFSAAALGAEGLAADVMMVVGNGYAPGHAQLALDLVRDNPALRRMFADRLSAD